MFKTLEPVDLATLGLVTVVASTGVPAWLGVQDRLSITALTMGLACPAARRLIAWRRGAAPLRFGADRTSSALVWLAMLPWVVIPAMHSLPWPSMASLVTAHIAFPIALRVAGALLTIGGVLRPMMSAFGGGEPVRSSAYIETVGLFLVSGNVVLGTMAASWLLASTRMVPHAAGGRAQFVGAAAH